MNAVADRATTDLRGPSLRVQRRVPKRVPRRAPKLPGPPHGPPKPPKLPKKPPGPPRRRLPVRPLVDRRVEYMRLGVREELNP
ncbi:MAG: hypothetical protein OEU87_09110 [Nitrospira sp.]|nr:hypothetical protein [Nitrospira sp.]